MFKIFVTAFFLVGSYCSVGIAAQITFEQDPVMGCFATLSGTINNGDGAQIKKVLVKAANEFELSVAGDYSPGANNSVQFEKRLCLDSPGGSFIEAIKIAKLIESKWSTAVGAGKTCQSACAIIFMAGSISPEDDRGVVARRFLHPLGKLGFHAPSLNVTEGEYSASSVSKAYNIALSGLGQIYAIAGYIKFPASLIGAMIATPPEEMMYIETVGQASRWHIGVAPVVEIKELSKLAVINACNNDYLFKSEVITLNGMYDNKHKIYYGAGEPKITDEEYRKVGKLGGFGQEAASECFVYLEKANNERERRPTDFAGWVGIGEDDVGTEIYHSQFFGPSTPIRSLAKRDDKIIETVPVQSRSMDVRNTNGHCYIILLAKIIDSGPCVEIKEMKYKATAQVLTSYVWPSGGKTAVQISDENDVGSVNINGIMTQSQFIAGNDPTHKWHGLFAERMNKQNAPYWEAECWDDATTGNTFCFQQVFD